MVFGFGGRKKTEKVSNDASEEASNKADESADAVAENGGTDNAQATDATNEEDVNILRFLQKESICMDLDFVATEPQEEETEAQVERRLMNDKERLIQDLVDILDQSGQIVNPTKFYKDMVNRERKATTAIAPGIAIPHVRSMQCRQFTMGFARAKEGLPFGSLDGGPTKLFFMMCAPPYEDRLYLKVYRQFAEMISNDWVVDAVMEAETPDDLMNILRGYIVQ